MQPVLERLRDYFQDIANGLGVDKSISAVLPNPVDVGTARENIIREFLTRHLPQRCKVIKGGFIFDSLGNESKQMDLIVINDLTLQFEYQGIAFNCVEGCYCAISVKTRLDKLSLIDALENIASIPGVPDLSKNLNPLLLDAGERLVDWPYKVIFAFDGADLNTIQGHLEEFYHESSIPLNRRPNLLIVNNKYAITRIGPHGSRTTKGTHIPGNSYWPLKHEGIGGYLLIYLLSEIQEIANLGSHLMLSFDKYRRKLMP